MHVSNELVQSEHLKHRHYRAILPSLARYAMVDSLELPTKISNEISNVLHASSDNYDYIQQNQ